MDKQFVVTTRNTQVKQSFYRRTDPTTPLAPRQFVVGLVQHPNTGLFQVWISTNGLDVISVSARKRIMEAETDIQTIKAVLGSQDIYDQSKMEALFTRLDAETDEQPRTLPEQVVLQICREILLTVAHQPRRS